MRFSKLIIFLYSLIFLSILSIKDNLIKSDFIDLYPTWIAASLYTDNKKEAIYDSYKSNEWINYETKLVSSAAGDSNYDYIPVYLYPYIIISKLISYSTFKNLFLIINITLVSYIISYYSKYLNFSNYIIFVIVSIILFSEPIYQIIKFGQNTFILFILYKLYLVKSLNKKYYSSTLLLIGMIFIKPWAIIFILLPFLLRFNKLFIYNVIGIFLLIIVNFSFEFKLSIKYIELLLLNSNQNLLSINNISIQSVLTKIFFLDQTNKKYLYSWNSKDFSDINFIKFSIYYLYICLIFTCYYINKRKYTYSIFKLSPLFIINVFWNHYLILYLKDFFKKPFTNIYTYTLIFIYIILTKFDAQNLINYISANIIYSDLYIEYIIALPIFYLIYKEFKYNKYFTFNFNYFMVFLICIYMIYLYYTDKRLNNIKFNYLSMYIFYIIVVYVYNKYKLSKNLIFSIISIGFITITYYYSTIYYPDIGIKKFKIYMQIIYAFYVFVYIIMYHKYNNEKYTFIFTLCSSTTIFNSFLYNSPGYKYSFLLLYLIIYILMYGVSYNRLNIIVMLYFAIIFYISPIKFNFLTGSTLFISINLISMIFNRKNSIINPNNLQVIINTYKIQFVIFLLISLFSINDYLKLNPIYYIGIHINSLGSFFSMMIIFIFINIRKKHNEKKYLLNVHRIVDILILILSIILLMYTKSRSNILSLLLSSIFLLIINNKNYIYKKIIYIGIYVVFIVLLTFIISQYSNIESIKARWVIINHMTSLVFNNSLMLGFGLESSTLFMNFPFGANYLFFKDYINVHGINLHAHNLIVQVIFTSGLLGLLLVMIITYIMFKRIYSHNHFTNRLRLYIFLYILIQSIFDLTLTDNFIIIPISIILLSFNQYITSRKILSIKYSNIIIYIFSSYLFLNGYLISKYYNLIEIVKPSIVYNIDGSISINQKLPSDIKYEVDNLDKSIFVINISNYPLKQLLSEIYFNLYLDNKDLSYLKNSIKYSENCIKDNRYEVKCISTLIKGYSILGNKEEIEHLENLLLKYDPNKLLNNIK